MNGSQIRYRSGYKYQLIEEYRIAVAGMSRLRARLVHWVVNKFGEPSASPESRKPVSVAP